MAKVIVARRSTDPVIVPPPVDPPVDPPPPTTGPALVSSPYYPFDTAAPAEWDALGDDYLFAPHAMATWRRRIGNNNWLTTSTSYEMKYWISPGGLEPNGTATPTDWTKYGGWVRDFAMPAAPGNATTWEQDDKTWELQQYKAIGGRHMIIDILNSGTFKHVQQWAVAAQIVGIKLIPMLDCGASIVRNGAANAASFISQLYSASNNAVWLRTPLGAKVVAAYAPETAISSTKTAFTDAQLATYWTSFKSALESTNGPSVFVPVYSRAWRDATEHATTVFMTDATLKAWVWKQGRWGVRNAVGAAAAGSDASDAITYSRSQWGKPFVVTGAVQDQRPDQSKYEEAGGWDTIMTFLDQMMKKGQKDDWFQFATWNDYREGTQLAPSWYNGYATLDMMAYFLFYLRFRKRPKIIRDAIMPAYRQQQAHTTTPQPTYTAGATYTARMVRSGSTVERNQIDALVFSKADGATFQIKIKGVAQSLTMPVQPGVTTAQTGTTINIPTNYPIRVQAPLAAAGVGQIVFTLSRGGLPLVTTSNTREVNFSTRVSQDMAYVLGNSLRG